MGTLGHTTVLTLFQDYGTMSGYSTLKSGPGPATGRDQENLDYETLSRSGIVSEEELEKWVLSRDGHEPS